MKTVSRNHYQQHRVDLSENKSDIPHDWRSCPICQGRHKTILQQKKRRETRSMIADMCGTSYAAAKRDMGL
jgi:hypothetical protein